MTNSVFHTFDGATRTTGEASLKFGRFRMLPRQRLLLADGVPVGLGTRAFELLLALLEADGSLVTKAELFARVWPGIVVEEVNLKVQVSALRKALGEDRDFIHTEHGRGYRVTATVRWANAWGASDCPVQARYRSTRNLLSQRMTGGRRMAGRQPARWRMV